MAALTTAPATAKCEGKVYGKWSATSCHRTAKYGWLTGWGDDEKVTAFCGYHIKSQRSYGRKDAEVVLIGATLEAVIARQADEVRQAAERRAEHAERERQRNAARMEAYKAQEEENAELTWEWVREEVPGWQRTDVVYRVRPTNGTHMGLRYEIRIDEDEATGRKYLNVMGSSKVYPGQAAVIAAAMAAAAEEVK